VSAAPGALEQLREEIETALSAALDRLLPRLVTHHDALGPVADELRAFLSGGKRIRPVLLLLGYEAALGEDRRRVLGPALALELLHTCALVHDDVIDQASTRRGRPTVHHAFARVHRESGWAGAPMAYGEAVAILVGDLAFVHADELFLDAEVPAERLLAGLRHFGTLREEVMAGQYLDLHAAASATTDRATALSVATLKSGRYSIARPLELGALLAGAEMDLVAGLGRFGDPLGRAFQVRDDLLGVFGDQAATGKSVASDLSEGKRTLLVAETLARLDPAARADFEAEFGDPGLGPAGADRLRSAMEDCGARAATEDYVREAVAEARGVLEDLELPGASRDALGNLATYLVERSS
jgi:geranylgeranyl diphosphate synthase, type I